MASIEAVAVLPLVLAPHPAVVRQPVVSIEAVAVNNSASSWWSAVRQPVVVPVDEAVATARGRGFDPGSA